MLVCRGNARSSSENSGGSVKYGRIRLRVRAVPSVLALFFSRTLLSNFLRETTTYCSQRDDVIQLTPLTRQLLLETKRNSALKTRDKQKL